VLGDMMELGKFSEKEHAGLVDSLIDSRADVVLTLGDECKAIVSDELSIVHFDSKEALHKMLAMELKQGDAVLVKGSRGMKMEETVEYIRQHVI
jgi:UDP-N-acetylmuramoyl-tripeptide--D-alanyl-D-alanine ligase